MDALIYRSAMSGDWDTIKQLCTDFHTGKTPNGNTILHVLAELSDYFADSVKQIVEQEPDLVYSKNIECETPLVIASRKGHYNFVRALIDSATSTSLFSGHKNNRTRVLRDLDYRTAALEALRNNAHEIAKLLLVEGGIPVESGVPGDLPPWMYTFMSRFAPFLWNQDMESVLYLAVRKGYDDIVALILPKSTNLTTHCGPLGRTPLHAAALSNSPGCMELILQRFPNITREVDMVGWSAIHYVSMLNHTECVKLLLSKDSSLGYLRMKAGTDDGMTALHVAVYWGHVDAVRDILFYCPDCWEMITLGKRKNILHLAVENERQQVLEFILGTSWGPGLINKKDGEGNTPLHLYVSTDKLDGNKLVNHPCTDKNATNNDSSTPLEIIEEADVVAERQNLLKDELLNAGATPQLRSPFYPLIKNANPSPSDKHDDMKTYMIVATLIVTVTFAAGFTVPGGFDTKAGNEGMAVLSKHAAFTAFVVTDSLSLMFSLAAILIRLFSVMKNKSFVIETNPNVMATYIASSLLSMLIAFMTGVYVVLPVQALKIYLIVVGSVFALLFYLYSLAISLTLLEGLNIREWFTKRSIRDGVSTPLI